MKQSVPETVHLIDAEGHLVRLENESDADYIARTATVLHQTGNSTNHPDLVMSQYDEPDPPPPEMNPEESEAYATERSKKAEEDSRKAGPQPTKGRPVNPDIEPVIGGPIRG